VGVHYLPPPPPPPPLSYRTTHLSISMHTVSRLPVWPYQRPALHPFLPPALVSPEEDAFSISHLVKLFGDSSKQK